MIFCINMIKQPINSYLGLINQIIISYINRKKDTLCLTIKIIFIGCRNFLSGFLLRAFPIMWNFCLLRSTMISASSTISFDQSAVSSDRRYWRGLLQASSLIRPRCTVTKRSGQIPWFLTTIFSCSSLYIFLIFSIC